MTSRSIPPLIVAALGVLAVVFVALGSPKHGIGTQNMASLQGCYDVDGKSAFRVAGATIFASGESPGFEALRQKDRDVLSLDRPVQMAFQPVPILVQAGQGTLIPIHYGNPLALEFLSTDAKIVYARKVTCKT